MSLPYDCGAYDINVDTWRPLLPGPKGEMKRYFIGGTPELDDLAYAGTPSYLGDSKILSRYGFRTATSGRLRIRMNVIHQSQAFTLTDKKGTKKNCFELHYHITFSLTGSSRRNLPIRNLMDRLSSASLFSSVSTVMAAFAKARERFERAKEGYDLNIAKNEE